MNVGSLPVGLEPIVQPIDDWNRNLKLAMLFECAVGPGRLMVTSRNLSEAGMAGHAGGPSLRRSMPDYMASARFRPAVAVSAAEMDAWMAVRYTASAGGVAPAKSPDVVDPGQVKRG
jgi:hypothetical protein